MIKLFLDIETLPCDDDMKETVIEILKKKHSNKDKDPEQLFLESGFDGTFGRICCIGYLKETRDGSIEKGVIRGDEKAILTEFWSVARDVDVFIGHNVMDFDLPFIYQRTMVQNIRPSINVSFVRYRNNPIYDTMKEWSKWAFNQGPKLDSLAKVLKLQTSKDAMDGSEVWKYYQEGKIDEICAYCMKDVVLTRQVYYRMNFMEASDIPGIEAYTTVQKDTEETKETHETKEDKPSVNESASVISASVLPNGTSQPSLLGDTEEIPF